MARFQEVMAFIEGNHRNPYKFNPDEKGMVNSQNYNPLLRLERVEPFNKLQELGKKYKRVNQWK